MGKEIHYSTEDLRIPDGQDLSVFLLIGHFDISKIFIQQDRDPEGSFR